MINPAFYRWRFDVSNETAESTFFQCVQGFTRSTSEAEPATSSMSIELVFNNTTTYPRNQQ